MKHLLIFLIMSTATLLTAQTPVSKLKLAVDSIITANMKRSSAVGVAVGIVKDGKMFYCQGYGSKRFNSDSPVDSLTNFHLASISKVFVATAIMQLEQDGKIKLDDKLVDIIPVNKLRDERFKQVSIRQMLLHLSGIPDVENYHWDKPHNDSLAIARYSRKSIETEKLLYQPGSKWEYSNMAFDILAGVIEVVSKEKFEDYMRHHIFDLTGMARTSYNYNEIEVLRRSSPHIKRSGWVSVSAVYPYNREHAGSSALNSCSYDMCQWIINLLNIYDNKNADDNGVLKQRTLKEMWSPQHSITPEISIGMTWPLSSTPLGSYVGHDGLDLGYSSSLVIFPKRKIGVILMSNGDYNDFLYELGGQIAWTVADSVIARADATPEYLKLLAGKYTSVEKNIRKKLQFDVVNGELVGIDQDYHFKLIYIGNGTFINAANGDHIAFNAEDPKNIKLLMFDKIGLRKVE